MAKQRNQAEITDEAVRSDLNFGEIDAAKEAELSVVDPMENVPSFVPNQEGFMKGTRLAGIYLGTRRVYSEKFTAGKRAPDGRKYRDLHMFRHEKHGRFNIWSVGILGMVLRRAPIGELLTITYQGQATEALKVGQSPPHLFEIKGKNLVLDTETLDESNADRDLTGEAARA